MRDSCPKIQAQKLEPTNILFGDDKEKTKRCPMYSCQLSILDNKQQEILFVYDSFIFTECCFFLYFTQLFN